MQNKFKIISYIKYPDGTFDAPGNFKLYAGDYTKIVEYYNLLVKKYCQIHNYKFQFREIEDTDLEDINNQLTDDWYLTDNSTINKKTNLIILYKIKYIKEVLNRLEDKYVVFFDTDAIPSNPNIKLEMLIDNQHEFFVSPGNKYADYITATNDLIPEFINLIKNAEGILDIFLHNPVQYNNKILTEKNINILAKFEQFIKIFSGFNEGFIIVKNTEKMRKLFELMCNNYNLSIHRNFNSGTDGHLFSYFLSSNYFYSSLKYMDFNCMGHHFGYGPYRYDENKTFLLHDSDIISMYDRTKLFEIMTHNKWWTPILNNMNDNVYLLIIKYTSLKEKDIINKIQDFYNKNHTKAIYLTMEYFYSKKHYNEFLKLTDGYNFKIWADEKIDKIFEL